MPEFFADFSNILVGILAFSVLIFVHELGHYLAAIAVGVRPERFFIGFDIYGLAIKKEIKGCVYGIGLLPFGGYVKLAGQSDDPREQNNGTGAPDEYCSKSLPARALVISAGVIMNMLFGFAILVYAYSTGIPEVPAVIGGLDHNSPAYLADIRPGDKVLNVNGKKFTDYKGVAEYIAMNKGTFAISLERKGKQITRQVVGSAARGLNDIGLLQGYGVPKNSTIAMVDERYAGLYKDSLQEGDQLLSVNGVDTSDSEYGGVLAEEIFDANPGRKLQATVLRDGEKVNVAIPVIASGVYDFGCTVAVKLGGVVEGTPAEAAGLEANDIIKSISINKQGQGIISAKDLTLKIRSQSYQPVEVAFVRDGAEKKVLLKPEFLGWNVKVSPGQDTLLGVVLSEGTLEVKEILQGAGSAKIFKTGDKLLTVNGNELVPDKVGRMVADASCKDVKLGVQKYNGEFKELTMSPRISLDTGAANIGVMIGGLPKVNKIAPGTEASKFLEPGAIIMGMTLSADLKKTKINWVTAEEKAGKPVTFDTPAGVIAAIKAGKMQSLISGAVPVGFDVARYEVAAASIPQAMSMAFDKSIDLSLTIYKMLGNLVRSDVPVKALAGPLSIVDMMSKMVESSTWFIDLLMLVALISINLAVLNLLPIPVLDGGHLFFIIIEAIKGSPPGPRLQEATQYVGVICLLGLMLYVTFNDINRIYTRYQGNSIQEKAVELEENGNEAINN